MQNKKWQIVVLAVLVLLVVGTGLWWMQQQTPVAPPMRPIKKAAPAALPTETAKPTPKPDSGVAVPPITEINPRTVYSGNLGTLTGIQAGADIKKMELEFAPTQCQNQRSPEKGRSSYSHASSSFAALRLTYST